MMNIFRKDFTSFEEFQEVARAAEYRIQQIRLNRWSQKDLKLPPQNPKRNPVKLDKNCAAVVQGTTANNKNSDFTTKSPQSSPGPGKPKKAIKPSLNIKKVELCKEELPPPCRHMLQIQANRPLI